MLTSTEEEIISLACQEQICSLQSFFDINDPHRLILIPQFESSEALDKALLGFIAELEHIQEEPTLIEDISWFNGDALKHILGKLWPSEPIMKNTSESLATKNILFNLYLKDLGLKVDSISNN